MVSYPSRFTRRDCSCTSPVQQEQQGLGPKTHQAIPTRRATSGLCGSERHKQIPAKTRRVSTAGAKPTNATDITKTDAPDHRALGTELSLFIGDISSPGSPLFQPDGTHIFQKLQAFLRAQYPSFGYQEVITPNLYKEDLWRQSGHWENYKDAMFTVKGGTVFDDNDNGRYSLKPMNCPGHCLLYKSRNRSWRELPIRYADFAALHRNETSGSLSGLTRVRRFHQDDGHIFCTPDQVRQEIISTLNFVDMVYDTLRVGPYKLFLSTKPFHGFIGSDETWKTAEDQLKDALDQSGHAWSVNAGEGAFYGPKIDIVLTDKHGKEHQTATIQLDFQLPKRFGLQYVGQEPGVPIMIHRAILGSLERFMALLIEQYEGHWPFWLSPRQLTILTVGDSSHVLAYASEIAKKLASPIPVTDESKPLPLSYPRYNVDTDFRYESLAKKLRGAKTKKYNIICIIGEKNMKEKCLDLDFSAQPMEKETLEILNRVKPGTRSPIQGIVSTQIRGIPGVKLNVDQTQKAMEMLCESYL
ncbi:MAG: hypothetical protein Q9195_004132 [Heterodermia aff. obscurata]